MVQNGFWSGIGIFPGLWWCLTPANLSRPIRAAQAVTTPSTRCALVNARFVVNKIFLQQHFFTSHPLAVLFLSEIWINTGEYGFLRATTSGLYFYQRTRNHQSHWLFLLFLLHGHGAIAEIFYFDVYWSPGVASLRAISPKPNSATMAQWHYKHSRCDFRVRKRRWKKDHVEVSVRFI